MTQPRNCSEEMAQPRCPNSCTPRPVHDDAVSPLTDSSSPPTSVTTSPVIYTPTDSALSRFKPLLCRTNSNTECFSTGSSDLWCVQNTNLVGNIPLTVVVSDDPEPAGVENPVTGYHLPQLAYIDAPELENQDLDIYAGLGVVPSREPSTGTVTPLHLLGDQPDWIDCPFCERRARTVIKKKPSHLTHMQAAFLLVATGPGVAIPYAAKWCFNSRSIVKGQGCVCLQGTSKFKRTIKISRLDFVLPDLDGYRQLSGSRTWSPVSVIGKKYSRCH
ncbi:hypothetical protein B0J13DRAFT_527381 [Dactylonectria estremocensis]|uniref:LITAF domain-containing protein n=1 Tax=Dactylonectria estremocensis TaxID=1079267 RepID=A0A9P9EL83_9HYPO|nr:hypothetical protein B0J13DRAFT_527381 [Dactylonectria estremocensis]